MYSVCMTTMPSPTSTSIAFLSSLRSTSSPSQFPGAFLRTTVGTAATGFSALSPTTTKKESTLPHSSQNLSFIVIICTHSGKKKYTQQSSQRSPSCSSCWEKAPWLLRRFFTGDSGTKSRAVESPLSDGAAAGTGATRLRIADFFFAAFGIVTTELCRCSCDEENLFASDLALVDERMLLIAAGKGEFMFAEMNKNAKENI